ncbi:hypothetical protein RIF29_18032 [Crotalaria pallida]|uniref:Bifunctional inhibitor/plant lipid transfer protein/seed storage helical domain-containing protein n=1 Tax=Crotalaria pallida TaxID=3830 RepID=A0AAN9FLI3_CROPI
MPSIAADCDDSQMASILQKCDEFIQKGGQNIPPSQKCCSVLKDVDFPCICDTYVTPPVEDAISIEKLIYVAKSCGCQVPPSGAKCGIKLHHSVPDAGA